MTTHPDVLIVGGGVIGLTLGRQLRIEGLGVCLLERYACGREASWAGAGILAPCNPQRSDALFQFQERSLELYPALCTELHAETGIDPEYERCGELELLFTEQAVAIARADERGGMDRLLVGDQPRVTLHRLPEVHSLEPLVTTDLLGALECRQTAQLRNPRLLAALLESCQSRGVDIQEHCPVNDLLVADGCVTGVMTASGPRRAGVVILCAGAWSAEIGARLGVTLAVHPVRGQMILLKLEQRPFQRIIARGRTYLVPRRDGHVLLGSTEEPEAGFVKRNTPQGVTHLLTTAIRLVPSLADAPVAAFWSGLRPGSRDDKPIIGAVPHLPGLYVATGHFRSGLTNAPATAEYVAALLAKRPYAPNLAFLAPPPR